MLCHNSGRERAIIKPEIIGEDESESEQSDEAKHSSDSEEDLDQDEVNLNMALLFTVIMVIKNFISESPIIRVLDNRSFEKDFQLHDIKERIAQIFWCHNLLLPVKSWIRKICAALLNALIMILKSH